jgi:L-rhamnose-H+ transport protein
MPVDTSAVLLIVGGGVCGGLLTTPMAWMPSWEWENIWLLYSIAGMVVWPWALVLSTVPSVWEIYETAETKDIVLTAVFGAGWGLGSTLFGVGTNAVGNSLGFSIILGLTATLGSAIVLVALHPKDIATREGHYTFAGLAVTMVGLACCGYAGSRKEREQVEAENESRLLKIEENASGGEPKQIPFCVGMVICLLSGALSPMLNLGLAFGNDGNDGMQERATHYGVGLKYNNNPTWCVGVGAGFVVNALYCCYKLCANGTWSNYCPPRQPAADASASIQGGAPSDAWHSYTLAPWYHAAPGGVLNWIYCLIMGLLWYGGNVVYGIGSNMLGELGDAVGWPVFIVTMVVTGNVSGALTGEWEGTSCGSKAWMLVGNILLAVGVVVGVLGTGGTDSGSGSDGSKSGIF